MGMIKIEFDGSFGPWRTKAFSAREEGHAAAVGEAIRYLANVELPAAIRNDHMAGRDGEEPERGFAGMGKIHE